VAIASSVCALVSIVFFLPGLTALLDPTVLRPQSSVVGLTALATLLATAIAFLLGVGSLLDIAVSGGRRTGYGFGAFGTVMPVVVVFGLLFYVPAFFRIGGTAYRMTCGSNLSGIGKAMLIYANDSDGRLPAAGGPNARWAARVPSWAAQNRSEAYGWSDPNAGDGQASVSASLYLFVKHGAVEPKRFVCSQDPRAREFKPRKYGTRDREPSDFWDFGPNPPRHCSYAYHMPYGPNRLTTSLPPGLAVAADRNPWIDSPSARAGDFSRCKPDVPPFNGTSAEAKNGNTVTHMWDGQNVLFLDSHVEFAKRSFCGLDDDNIYTLWNGSDKIRGTPPTFGSMPADRLDSLLVNDPPVP